MSEDEVFFCVCLAILLVVIVWAVWRLRGIRPSDWDKGTGP